MNVCVECGESLADVYCYACAKATIPQDLIPTRCWDCGRPILTPPNQRYWLGLCDQCTVKYLLRRVLVIAGQYSPTTPF